MPSSEQSSEQIAKIWELNLVYTTPLRTTKKLVWIGFKRILEQRSFSKSLPFQHSNVPWDTQDLWTLCLGADSGKQMVIGETVWRNQDEKTIRKLCLDMSSNSFPSVKMLSCYCHVRKAAWGVWADSLLFYKEIGKSETFLDIPIISWMYSNIQKANAKVIWGLVMEKIYVL